METYTKKIVELSKEEKHTLKAAADILDSLAVELDDGDFFSCQRGYHVGDRKFSVHNRELRMSGLVSTHYHLDVLRLNKN